MGTSSDKSTGQTYPQHPFLTSISDLLQHLGSDKERGLSVQSAQQAQQKYGPNKLKGDDGVQWYSILAKQVSNAMILVCNHRYNLNSQSTRYIVTDKLILC